MIKLCKGSLYALCAASFVASVLAAPAALAAGFDAPGLAPRAPQIMLSITRSLGAGGSIKPTFGLHVQQVRLMSNSGDPGGGSALKPRELVAWQMETHSDFRMELGHRLTWDFTNGRFGKPGSRSTMALAQAPSASYAHNSSVSYARGAEGASGGYGPDPAETRLGRGLSVDFPAREREADFERAAPFGSSTSAMAHALPEISPLRELATALIASLPHNAALAHPAAAPVDIRAPASLRP